MPRKAPPAHKICVEAVLFLHSSTFPSLPPLWVKVRNSLATCSTALSLLPASLPPAVVPCLSLPDDDVSMPEQGCLSEDMHYSAVRIMNSLDLGMCGALVLYPPSFASIRQEGSC